MYLKQLRRSTEGKSFCITMFASDAIFRYIKVKGRKELLLKLFSVKKSTQNNNISETQVLRSIRIRIECINWLSLEHQIIWYSEQNTESTMTPKD